jgi:acyl-CoA synthetase (AMP-forming)/AMP-acid ligase II
MRGLMMNTPLLITAIMRHAQANYPDREIVSVTADQAGHRYTYKEAFRRSRQLANALKKLGIIAGDRVATLAWNDHRHFEAYYAVSCAGNVLHTINPRLFPAQVAYILNHAASRCVLVDPRFVPLLDQLQDRLEHVEAFIVLTDKTGMPETKLRNAISYEEFIAGESEEYDWPDLDENTASSICYTSGTTGNPKGVVYTHRSTVLHAMAISMPDVINLSARDTVMPIVPMFHVHAWGTPYAAPMVGARLVLPGAKVGNWRTLHRLIDQEQVSLSLAVPTVWMGLLAHLSATGSTVESLQRVVVGGAACPSGVIEEFRDRHGVDVHHSWGMTEMSPVGTLNRSKPGMENLTADEKLRLKLKQGRALFGVEMKITDDDNHPLPWDGKSRGALKVRGPWVCSEYYHPDEPVSAHDADGWFDTGDVATIDADGFMQISDRTKDLIKSGGEWISSIELENIAVDHPQVTAAAVIAIPHPKWSERPLLVVVPEAGGDLTGKALKAWYRGKVARWWIPDDVIFVDELPYTATGKVRKNELRKQFAGHKLHSGQVPS